MSFTLYSATVPSFLQTLPAMSSLVDQAEAHCQSHDLPASELIGAQLAPDMWNFAAQIRAVGMHSAAALEGAIKGVLAPTFTEPPSDFAGLRALVDDAIARVKAITPEAINDVVGQNAEFRFGQRKMEFVAEDLLLSFSLPNFYFHASAAYAILRMKGVAIGKANFLGALRLKAAVAA